MSGYNGRKLNHKLNCSLNNRGFSLVEILIGSSDSRTVCSSFTESIVTSPRPNAGQDRI